jgi:predicted metalloprotease with PDZ domain
MLFALAFVSTTAVARGSSPSAPFDIQYKIHLLRPTTHLLDVEINADQVHEPELDFVMPAWSPGRYAIYNFAKNVQEFEALGSEDKRLAWTRLDKQTWRVDTGAREGAPSSVRVRYRVYANDLNGTFSQFDSSHANLNGASVFMYIAGHQPDPITLTVDAPPAWKVISGFSESTEQRTLRVRNYDLLVDTPMEVSPECTLDEFREGGKTFRVAVHSYSQNDDDRSKFLDGLKRIVRAEMAMMPAPDFEQYTFLFHFAPDISQGDGMEHFNSTQIIVRGTLAGGGSPDALETAAHEFFHLWNVKRLRPAGLGPFDYRQEAYTPSLWFAEGITSYYAYVNLLRSGVWDRAEFLRHLAEEIRAFEFEPGRDLMSAESSSFQAWFYDRSPQTQETNFANSTISYYNKGLLLGMLLDLEIRSRTEGEKSLDDLLRTMYQKFYEGTGREAAGTARTYYAPGRGYEEKDILTSANEVLGAGGGLDSFFDSYVRGTDPLPYAQTLALAGLALRAEVRSAAAPSLGVLTRREDRGVRIVAVRPGGVADRAGLARDDLLVAVDELSLATELDERLGMYRPGASVSFTVERHGKQERIFVTLGPAAADIYSLEDLPGASAQQVRIRNGWLRNEKRRR